ncbi:MAG: glycine--tRNA ligase subunit beta [Pseudomonadales bacterium]|nr:glycine--tRNA ligase subunit beta [Pseudomonadales bacterium]
MSARDLLIEIGTEELPPKALAGLSSAFEDSVCKQLKAKSLQFDACQRFATPRRLALLLTNLQESQADQENTRFGPAVKAAFDSNGNPTPAAEGFARSCGVSVEELQRAEKDGVEKLSYTLLQKGVTTKELVPDIVIHALAQLPIPKRMRWGSSRTEFVRPVHWSVLLFGEEVIEATILDVESSNKTFGHRFHSEGQLTLTKAQDYETLLETQGKVIPCFDKRKELIREQVLAEASQANATAVIEDDLLNEVTALVEFPVALTGDFDAEYLEVPQEALVLAMKSHQKCFNLVDGDQRLVPKFITISNLESKDPAQVIEGNERVIRPRLADARFFFETDKQSPLASRYEQLGNLVFQDKLGTVKDKCDRVSRIAKALASQTNGNPDYCERAAELSKCDLLTNMVGEFADLQGLMGYYYALNDGEAKEVAQAIDEQYQPRFAGDAVPDSLTGALLAISDKLDSIVGLFGIGQPPTGSKDPFALRRAAIGVLRIMIEKQLALDLASCIDIALENFSGNDFEADTAAKVFEFMLDRFRAWYLDEGISAEEFQSVFELKPTSPLDFHQRIQAVHHFNSLPEAAALAAANKRVSNILSKETASGDATIDQALLTDTAESDLFALLGTKEAEVEPLFAAGKYTEGLQALSVMKDPVDQFFDKVLVMADDDRVRHNRLALLSRLQTLFLHTADISQLHKS